MLKLLVYVIAIFCLGLERSALCDDIDDDLYGLDDALYGPAEEASKNKPKLNSTQIISLPPQDQLNLDSNNKKIIEQYTIALVKAMGLTEQIVVAGYDLVDYTPDSNSAGAAFWKNTINPIIISSLVQDIKGRDLITKSFSSITNLAIIIQKGAEILRDSRGSATAIKIVQNSIPQELEKMKKLLNDINALETGAINNFANQTNEIFKIIGPKAADFVKQKSEQEDIIDREWIRKQNLITELANKQGNVTRLDQMIHILQDILGTDQNDLDKNKERTKVLMDLNSVIQHNINAIPDKVAQIKTVSTGWWIFKQDKSYVEMVDNPNKEAEKAYYESIIKARNEQIKQQQDKEEAQKKVIEDLKIQHANVKAQFANAVLDLNNTAVGLRKRIAEADFQIDQAMESIKNISSAQVEVENKIGSKGKTLIDCLTSVRVYAKKLGSQAAFSPLAAIISEIISMVDMDIQLLALGDKIEIYIAGSHLIMANKFISNYALEASKALNEISGEYRKIINSNEVQNYLAIEGFNVKF